jgi:hypothetical protein
MKQAINPELISKIFIVAPNEGMMEKNAWKIDPRKYQKPVMLF